MKRLITRVLMVLTVFAATHHGMGVALASPVYTLTNGTTSGLPVDPLSKNTSATAYYNFFSGSGHPDFGTQSNTGFFWLYENTNTNAISLGMIFDTPNDGTGGNVNLSFTGIPSTGFVALSDDSGESSTSGGSWGWISCCTDGAVIGGLNGLWDITLALNSSSGIQKWYFLSGDPTIPTKIALDMSDDVALTATPEPGTMMLLGTGLLGIIGYGWRRRQTTA